MGFPPTIFIILKQSRRFLFRGRNLISITLRKPIIIYCGTGLPTKDDRAELIQFFFYSLTFKKVRDWKCSYKGVESLEQTQIFLSLFASLWCQP